jgi:hypothetical protein
LARSADPSIAVIRSGSRSSIPGARCRHPEVRVPRADPGDGYGYGDTHVDAARAPPSHGQPQRWPAPSGQARVSGQRRRVDPASPGRDSGFFAILPQFVVLSASWPVPAQLAALFHIIACALV